MSLIWQNKINSSGNITQRSAATDLVYTIEEAAKTTFDPEFEHLES